MLRQVEMSEVCVLQGFLSYLIKGPCILGFFHHGCALSWHFPLPSLDLSLSIHWLVCHCILLNLSLSLFILCIPAYLHHPLSGQWLGRFFSFHLPPPDFLEIIDLLMIPIFTFSRAAIDCLVIIKITDFFLSPFLYHSTNNSPSLPSASVILPVILNSAFLHFEPYLKLATSINF